MTLDIGMVGSHTALLPEAGDALGQDSLIVDGQSGDVAFPWGKMKVHTTHICKHYSSPHAAHLLK
jgi:hypothetical protein